MDEASQILRHWLVLRKLSAEPHGVTIKQLAGASGVSDKTIRRDLADLRAAGFDIQERAGDFGRKTFLLNGGQSPAWTFTCDEALALYLCRTSAAPWSGTLVAQSLDNAFHKIRGMMSERACEYLERAAGRFWRTGATCEYSAWSEVLDQLQIGLEDSRVVRVTYRSERATEPVTYEVHPYGIVEHGGKIYVVGYAPARGQLRTWKLDRMTAAEATREPFERRADFDLQEHLAGSIGVFRGAEEVTVRVRFAPSAARYACEKRLHASQRNEPQRDGGVIVEWRVTSTMELRGYVLSFGAAAEVLEPSSLREEVRQEIEQLTRLYAADASPRRELRTVPSKPIANQLRSEEHPSADQRRRTKQRRAK